MNYSQLNPRIIAAYNAWRFAQKGKRKNHLFYLYSEECYYNNVDFLKAAKIIH